MSNNITEINHTINTENLRKKSLQWEEEKITRPKNSTTIFKIVPTTDTKPPTKSRTREKKQAAKIS